MISTNHDSSGCLCHDAYTLHASVIITMIMWPLRVRNPKSNRMLAEVYLQYKIIIICITYILLQRARASITNNIVIIYIVQYNFFSPRTYDGNDYIILLLSPRRVLSCISATDKIRVYIILYRYYIGIIPYMTLLSILSTTACALLYTHLRIL